MSGRTIRATLGIAIAATMATGGAAALAATATAEDAPAKGSETSYWFTQVEPRKGQGVFIRNGTTPAASGSYRLAMNVSSKHHDLRCFAESRGGEDFDKPARIKAGEHASVTIAERVPSGVQYNLMCFGSSTKPVVLEGAVTETLR